MKHARSGAQDASTGACAANNILGRWLHCGMAICLALCLGFSLGMAGRQATVGVPWALIAFNLHKFIGLNALLLVVLYIVWSAHGHARRLGDLFPWFSLGRLRAVVGELTRPSGYVHMQAVPAMVQGWGLASALVATASGLYIVLLQIAAGASASLGIWPQVHLIVSRMLWGYLLVHLCAVVLHVVWGQRAAVRSMFALFRPDEPGSRA